MTVQIGPWDFVTLHLAPQPGGGLATYERRLRHVVVAASGKPRQVIPDGVGSASWHRFKSSPHDRIVRAYVLIPVGIAAD